MHITIIDVETTGLISAKGSDQITQPYITEFFALKVNSKTGAYKEFETYVKPPVPIPKFLEKQIGITNEMVANAPTFLEMHKLVIRSCFNSHTLIAHNLSFDLECIRLELARIGKEHQFPYPPIHFCTVEQSMHITGYRLKNSELYKIATGKELEGAHKARNDAYATYESYLWLISQAKDRSVSNGTT